MALLSILRPRLWAWWYRWLVRPWLFRLPPERAQRLAEAALAPAWAWRAAGYRGPVSDPALRRTLAGIDLANPVGLAAGFDKQCRYLRSLGYLGFGYVVGGTVTPDPQPGNPRPRLLREVHRASLINSMGFPSDGLEAVAERLRRLEDPPAPVLVSIAALDVDGFARCHAVLEPLVAGVELNISSPNTQGLRRFQEPEELRALLERISAQRRKPLFVKLPPYFDQRGREQVTALLHEAVAAGVSGVTAINSVPVQDQRLAMGSGGLTGKAIFPDMLRVVRELRQEAGPGLAINACGGISNSGEALQALQAGADTVQVYTAMVYQGPSVASDIARGLVRALRDDPHNGAASSPTAQGA